ncbi:MAG: sensor domain-containing diguanylate cyclase [Rubrivivax sp.]
MADAGDELITHLMRAAEGAAAGLAPFDPEDRLRWANAWFRDTYGVDPALAPRWEDMLRACHRLRRGVLIETEDVEAGIEGVRQRYRSRPVRRFESDLCDGRWVAVTETLQPDGWLLAAVNDVTPLKTAETQARQARAEAEALARSDPLTGLPNRRHVFERLDERMASSRAMRWPLAVAMLDIDHSKRLNDNHGHAAGDEVLRHFAMPLRKQLRSEGLVGRIGGEELLLVLPNTTLDGAVQTLQCVRAMIGDTLRAARLPLPAYGFPADLAAAQPGDTVDSLLRRADDALYRAKREGRGRDAGAEAPDSRAMRL